MGDFAVHSIQSPEMRNAFLRHLLRDVEAMERMLTEQQFEANPLRVGAEQELCVIDPDFTPSRGAPEILERSTDPHLTSEIARYNLEINLDPFLLAGDVMRKTHEHLLDQWKKTVDLAADDGKYLLLCGILPTINRYHLVPEFMSPQARYKVLNDIMRMVRGHSFYVQIQGVNELIASLDSVLFEACNTSFQMHLQVPADDYVRQYNWAQQIAGPVLSTSVNSPLLFGRELWMETRIALFRQSLDMRTSSNHLREKQARVFFGDHWLENSVAELFKEHIARFPLLVSRPIDEDSLEALEAGKAPALRALRVHNGTVYTWNRPCYGRTNGKPHLRIENRYVPSGPSHVDEMANFAFWLGLMVGQPDDWHHFYRQEPFANAKDNFYRASRNGLESMMNWFGREIPADRLVLDELLPMAEAGLNKVNLADDDRDYYLGIIADRVQQRATGARWQVRNFRALKEAFGIDHALLELTAGMYELQKDDQPVHEWPELRSGSIHPLPGGEHFVSSLMKTDLFTVQAMEPLSLVKAVMSWRTFRHLPVEDEQGNLVGLLTAKDLARLDMEAIDAENTHVADVMTTPLITVDRFHKLKDACALMKEHNIGCLPIIREEKMIGLITDTDCKSIGLW